MLRSKGDIGVSDHAFQRMHERNSWNKATTLRMVDKIYERGARNEKIIGRLRKWATDLPQNEDCECVVYGDYVYLFNTREKFLITGYPLPKSKGNVEHRVRTDMYQFA